MGNLLLQKDVHQNNTAPYSNGERGNPRAGAALDPGAAVEVEGLDLRASAQASDVLELLAPAPRPWILGGNVN